VGRGRKQVIVSLAQHGKEEVAQPCLGTLLHIVDHGDERAVSGIDVGADGAKGETEWLYLGPINIGQCHHGQVTAALQFKSKRDERIDVAEGANVREDNAHEEFRNWYGLQR